MEIAAETSGHAVVVSGVAVMISMAGLFLAGDVVFSSLAVGSILVVAVAVLGSLTVLPALLAKLGRWVDRPRVPVLWRLTAPAPAGRAAQPPRLWPALLRPALRHPLVTLVVSVGLLLALAAPALGMKLKFPGMEDLPRTTPAMQAYDRLTAAFPSTGTTHVVAVQAPAGRGGGRRSRALDDLAAAGRGGPAVRADRRGRAGRRGLRRRPGGACCTWRRRTPAGADEAKRVAGAAAPRPGAGDARRPARRRVRGRRDASRAATDYADHVRQKLPIVVAFVLLLTFLVMAWTFRSVVVALTSIAAEPALRRRPRTACWSWCSRAPGRRGCSASRRWAAIVSWLPLFLFVVLFGLSMDYHVFVVSRIREAVRSGMSDPGRGGATASPTSAGVVTSAAIVMVGVFSIFATLSTIDMKQLGVGLAAAILLDATIIRAVVLPSLMTTARQGELVGAALHARTPARTARGGRARARARVGRSELNTSGVIRAAGPARGRRHGSAYTDYLYILPGMTEPTFLILTALAGEARHGYAVMEDVRRISDGRVNLRAGTLYAALDRLRSEGLISVDREEVVDSRLRRYYRLTAIGAERLATETERMRRHASEAARRLRRNRAAFEGGASA